MRELTSRLREPLPGVPEERRRLVAHLLLRLASSRIEAPVPPREARAALFRLRSTAAELPRDEVVARCALELGVEPSGLLASLFADLPTERIAAPPPNLDPGEIGLRANLALARALIARAYVIRLALEGTARAVIRHATLRGLMCTVSRASSDDGVVVELSGPFALFRRTLLYGRALGAVLPVLCWTRRFRLEAECDLNGRRVRLLLGTGDPIFPSAEPRRFDSAVEERLARDFARLAPDWVIVREPEPIAADGHLFFPDFSIHPRSDPHARRLVEIVGFWSPEYLAQKFDRLRRARMTNLILCIDEARNVGAGDLPPTAAVVRYRRRIDAARVLALARQPLGSSSR